MDKRIDPTHIWDIRDDNLDVASKALLTRLVSLQHLAQIHFSNKSLADDLGVTSRTLISKMQLLARLGYIYDRKIWNESSQTKITTLNLKFIRQQILSTAPKKRRKALEQWYLGREISRKTVPGQGHPQTPAVPNLDRSPAPTRSAPHEQQPSGEINCIVNLDDL